MKLNRVEEELCLKLNTDNSSSKNPNKSPIKAQFSVPYHRTCGARFCPNGNILGSRFFCDLIKYDVTNENNTCSVLKISIKLNISLISVIFVNPTFDHSHNHPKSPERTVSLETDTKEIHEG